MEFRHSKQLIQQEASKHVLTGHFSDTYADKYIGFLRFIIFSAATGFVYTILAPIFRKKLYHPYVYSMGSRNKISENLTNDLLSRSKYKLSEDEHPEILIKTSLKNFILFTNCNIYYELLANTKVLNTKTTSGKVPLSQAREIKLRNNMTSCDVMMGDEVIGTLHGGESPRINRLLKELAKDVREGIDVA